MFSVIIFTGDVLSNTNKTSRSIALLDFSVAIQIFMTFSIQFIEKQSYRLAMHIQKNQLKVRLNLIRYASHEIRTPLNTAVIGLNHINREIKKIISSINDSTHQNAESSSKDTVSMTTFDYLIFDLENLMATTKLVIGSCNTATETLNDLLTFDKISEGKLTVDLKIVNPTEFVNDVFESFQLNARQVGINFSIEIVNESLLWLKSCMLSIDKFKISQVLRNLLSNAFKFTPENGEIVLKIENVHEKNNIVRFSVIDSGHGIEQGNLPKLFGQYVQFNAAELQNGKGSGLGLWISKSMNQNICIYLSVCV